MDSISYETIINYGLTELRPIITKLSLTRQAKNSSGSNNITRRGAIEALCKHFGYTINPNSLSRKRNERNSPPSPGALPTRIALPSGIRIIYIDPPYLSTKDALISAIHNQVTSRDIIIATHPFLCEIIGAEFPNIKVISQNLFLSPPITLSLPQYPIPFLPLPVSNRTPWKLLDFTINKMFNHLHLYLDFSSTNLHILRETAGKTNVIRALHMLFDVSHIEIARAITQGCSKGSLSCRIQTETEIITLTKKYALTKDLRGETRLNHITPQPTTTSLSGSDYIASQINREWHNLNNITTDSLLPVTRVLSLIYTPGPQGVFPTPIPTLPYPGDPPTSSHFPPEDDSREIPETLEQLDSLIHEERLIHQKARETLSILQQSRQTPAIKRQIVTQLSIITDTQILRALESDRTLLAYRSLRCRQETLLKTYNSTLSPLNPLPLYQQTLILATQLMIKHDIPFSCHFHVAKKTTDLVFYNIFTGGLYTCESLSTHELRIIKLCLVAALNHFSSRLNFLSIDIPIPAPELLHDLLQIFSTILIIPQ